MRNSISNKRRKGCEYPRLSSGLHTFMHTYAHRNTYTCTYTHAMKKKRKINKAGGWGRGEVGGGSKLGCGLRMVEDGQRRDAGAYCVVYPTLTLWISGVLVDDPS